MRASWTPGQYGAWTPLRPTARSNPVDVVGCPPLGRWSSEPGVIVRSVIALRRSSLSTARTVQCWNTNLSRGRTTLSRDDVGGGVVFHPSGYSGRRPTCWSFNGKQELVSRLGPPCCGCSILGKEVVAEHHCMEATKQTLHVLLISKCVPAYELSDIWAMVDPG
jgi:hypothetical protein